MGVYSEAFGGDVRATARHLPEGANEVALVALSLTPYRSAGGAFGDGMQYLVLLLGVGFERGGFGRG